jgi:hypothetical protein
MSKFYAALFEWVYAALSNFSFACIPSEPNTRSMRSVEMSLVLRFRIAVTRVRDVCTASFASALFLGWPARFPGFNVRQIGFLDEVTLATFVALNLFW